MGDGAHLTRPYLALARAGAIALSVVNLLDAAILVAALLVVTVAAGVFVQVRQNRPRPLNPTEAIEPQRLGADALGERATLLQFSTDTCTRCPGVHRVLTSVAESNEGVVHLDIDLTHRPDIAKHFQVMQTPTTFILDSDGVIQTRFGGAPGRDVLDLELERITADPSCPSPV